jgi:hypothetical protein
LRFEIAGQNNQRMQMPADVSALPAGELLEGARGQGPIRDRIIVGAVLAAVWAVAGAEVLSLFNALSFWPLLIWWSIPVACLIAVVVRLKLYATRFTFHHSKDWLLTAVCISIALILGTTFIVAIATPPNDIDSLDYHLPRQIYWMQQGHVDFHPANDLRQIIMPPLAEYIGVQLMILTEGDRLLNLIQWLALGLSALTASAIARDLECNPRLQALAGLLVVTVPVAALQAVNTKNDIVSAFFALAAMFFALKCYRGIRRATTTAESRPSVDLIFPLLIGASLGLLMLSKSSGILFAAPVAVWIGVLLLRSYNWARASACGLVIAAVALAINTGHFARMSNQFGSSVWVPKDESPPLSAELSGGRLIDWATLVNRDRSLRAFLSNVIRNATMHLATGNRAIDQSFEDVVTKAHNWLGIDLNDPRTTFSRGPRFKIKPMLTNENAARAPIHVWLAFFALPLILSSFGGKADPWLISLMCTPYLGFLLFCYFLAWQQWHARLHMPVLFSLCPFIVYALRLRLEKVLYAAAAIAAVLALYAVAFNRDKVVGKSSVFTRSSEVLQSEPYDPRLLREVRLVVHALKPTVVGVQTSEPEYPLQAAILRSDMPPPKLVLVNPRFVPRHNAVTTQRPDLVIVWGVKRPKTITFGAEHEYVLAGEHSELGLYLPPRHSLPPCFH